jgi:integrase
MTLEPPLSRPPLPREITLAIVLWVMKQGWLGTGLCVALMFETYARPSEVVSFRRPSLGLQLAGGSGKAAFLTVVLRAAELAVAGKTGELDHSVPLDRPRHQWLADLVLRWAAPLAPEDFLFDFGVDILWRRMQQAARALDLKPLAPCPYQCRHGGASHDRLVDARPLAEVQHRGGWKRFQSVRRYEKHGRVSLELQKLRPEVRAKLLSEAPNAAAACVSTFGQLFGGLAPASGASSSSSSLAAKGSRLL